MTVAVVATALASLAGAAASNAATGLHVSVKRIELPGSDASGSRALRPGPSGSVWVVGPREALQLSPSGRVLHNVRVPEGEDREGEAVEPTATATPDGGVSFFGSFELHAVSESPRLDHVSPAGVATSVFLTGLAPGDVPQSPLAVAPDGELWGVWSEATPPGGRMFSIEPSTDATASYPTRVEPYAISDGPGGDFWIVGRSKNAAGRLVVSLTTPTGVSVKTIRVPRADYPLQDEVLSAPAPGDALWIAVPGSVTHVSAAGDVSSSSLPYACETPYALASGLRGESLVLGTWPGETVCRRVRPFAMQLTRISPSGRVASTALPIGEELATPLPAFADGKLWVLAGNGRGSGLSKPAIYTITLR